MLKYLTAEGVCEPASQIQLLSGRKRCDFPVLQQRKSVISSRSWLPKINYDDLRILTLKMQHPILWIMSPSLRLSSRFVILNGVWPLVSCSKFANYASSSSRRCDARTEELVVHISLSSWMFSATAMKRCISNYINNKTMKRSKKW